MFNETLYAVFDPNIYAIDYVERYFSQEYDGSMYRTALDLCQKIFDENVNASFDNLRLLAKLIYPNKQDKSAVNLLEQTLQDEGELSSYMPPADNEVSIMTIHKSKGLEFNIVFHLDLYKFVLSNEYADQDGNRQNLNLHYVGVSRAIDACYLINGTQRYSTRQNDYVEAIESSFFHIPGLDKRRADILW